MLQLKFGIDMRQFARKMGAIGNKVIPYVRVTMEELAEYARQTAARYTPPTRVGRTKIRDMWRARHSRKAAVESYIIENMYKDQQILVFFEEGTTPHVIKAKGKKPLHWIDEDTGEDVFARIVHHPGTPAYQMIFHAEKETNIKWNYYIRKTFSMVDRVTK